MAYAKLNTAKTFLLGPILDTNGAAKTDEVVASIKVTKNGTVGAVDAEDTLTHNHAGMYVFVSDGGDFDTLGEVTFSLNSGTNAMAPVTFSVLPALMYNSVAAASGGNIPQAVAGAANGLFVAGTNASLTITGATLFTGAVTASAGIVAEIDGSLSGGVASVTGGVTLADGAIAAAKIGAGALDGKGDWNVGKTGYALTTADWNTVVPDAAGVVATALGLLETAIGLRTLPSADYFVVSDYVAIGSPMQAGAVTLANGAHGGAAATITLQTPIAASGNWAIVGSKMDLADTLTQTGVTDLKSKLGTMPASGNWNTIAPATPTNVIDAAAAAVAALQGINGDTLETLSDQLDDISTAIVIGAPTTHAATAGAVVAGDQGATAYTAADTHDDNWWEIAVGVGAAGVDVNLTFGSVGATVNAGRVVIKGRWSGAGEYCDVYAKDCVGLGWDQLSSDSTRMANAANDSTRTFDLLARHQCAETGEVQIRFYSASTTEANTLYLDRVNILGSQLSTLTAGEIADQVWVSEERKLTDPAAIATEAKQDTIISAIAGLPVPGDATLAALTVAAQAIIDHGDGAWTAADVSALATAVALQAVADAVAGISVTLSPEDIQAIVDGLVAGGLATADALAIVDAIVDAIKLKTDSIGTGIVTYSSWVAAGGTRRIFAGEDFLAADGRGLAFTITDYAGPSLTSATCRFRLLVAPSYDETAGDIDAADLDVTATIAVDGTTVTLSADLTAAQTAALLTAPPGTPMNYVYQYVATLASGSIVMLLAGRLTVSKAIL